MDKDRVKSVRMGYLFRRAPIRHSLVVHTIGNGRSPGEEDPLDHVAIGMSVQIGLDDNDETPNFGAGLMYALSLGS